MPLGLGMSRPPTLHVRSHDAATACGASRIARKSPRGRKKVAQSGSVSAFFEHPYTGGNGGVCGGRKIRGESTAVGHCTGLGRSRSGERVVRSYCTTWEPGVVGLAAGFRTEVSPCQGLRDFQEAQWSQSPGGRVAVSPLDIGTMTAGTLWTIEPSGPAGRSLLPRRMTRARTMPDPAARPCPEPATARAAS
jgi:hypothetical protein